MDHVMIALLPITTDWCKIDLPHLTLVYSGKVDEHPLRDFNEMSKDASAIAMLSRKITLRVTGVDKLGPPEELVSALILRPSSELVAMRNFVEKWNRSEYLVFKPHATIGPYPSATTFPLPEMLSFDRIMVAWGDDRVTFRLKE